MKDKFNFTPEDDGFHVINHETWINVTPPRMVGKYMYQKIADGNPINMVVESKIFTPCLSYRKFREIQEKKPWAEIVEGLKAMREGLL